VVTPLAVIGRDAVSRIIANSFGISDTASSVFTESSDVIII